jgi:hypothetical protein
MFLAPRTPVQSPQVYTAGTYVANYGMSPSEPANFRPAQFSFLPQPDYGTAREPSDPGVPDTNGGQPDVTRPIPSQPVVSSPQNQMKSREVLRTFTFEAPMRPLDVARNMYLDYTTTQSIKFYNKGCEKLPGDPFNGKMLNDMACTSTRQSQYVYMDIHSHHQRKTTHPTLYRINHGRSEGTYLSISG